MADVFLTEDYEDCVDESNEIESLEIETETDLISDSQNLLNSDCEDLNEPVMDNSDMTLKQGVSEPELFAAEDMLVNPDDLLPPVLKLQKYANSDIVFNRQVVVRNLLETLRLVYQNKDDVASVINVFCSICEDYDFSVRTELMVQLPHLVAFCKEVKLNNFLVQYLVPTLITYLGDDSNTVRKTAHSALVTLLEQGLLEKEIVTEKVCPLVLHLTDKMHPEDLRTESIVLMSKLVSHMGKKATEDLFFEPLFNLMTDPSNNIRKACASTFGDICTAVGRETTENTLLPKFLELCKDGAWCVRKACTENFMALSCCVSKETRCNELSSVYMNLLKDTSRWVRLTAYQSLGGFISTFADPDRTGLYYSKDGTLTIVDTSSSQVLTPLQEPSTNPSNEALSNEEIKESNSLSSDDSSSLDRTNSLDSCDSIVPVCNAGTDSSASEVSCHAGNNCSVIEASTSTMTSSGEDGIHAAETMLTNDSSNGSFHCDSEQLTSNVNSCDNWISNSKPVQNGECHKKDVDDDEREFEKLWSEAVLTCDEVINGALNHNEMNGDVDIHASLDNELVQRIDSADASALLNSIAEFQHSNCETIPIISCNNSIKENGNNAMNFEDDSVCLSYLQHSRYTGDSDFSSDVIPNLVFTAQESNVPKDVSLDNDSQESVELKVNATTDNESAFNYFQYWREPLPEIDIDTATQCLNDSPEEEISSSNYLLLTDVFNNEHRRGWWSYLDDSGDSNRSFLSCSDLSTENSILREMRIIDDESSENKGEPPPGTKLYPRDQDIVPPELLMQYVCMPEGQNSATDAEIARHCAYSLPAVALTLGREFWPCLKDTFTVLMNDIPSFVMMWKVRRTLAFSMHQLAVILGPEITSKDLIPVFSRLISDLDEVRIGILQNLCEFLKVLLPEERKQFLPSLPKFLVSSSDTESNFKNWRFRLILAEQLVLIANLYEPQEVSDHLVPLSLTLIKDKICEVRLAAVRCMAATMKRLGQHPTPLYTKAVLSDLTDKFVHSHKWLQRQLYVYICQQIVIEEALTADQFAEDALPQLLYLCWDRVPNVRIAIARCLAIVMWPLDIYSNPGSPHRELLLQTIHTLQSDIDADVRFYANMVSTHECSCLQNGDFNNVEEPDV